MKNCVILAYPRDGLDFDTHIGILRNMPGAEAYKINSPRIDMSSSEIRKRCIEGRSISGLVPECIENKIRSIYKRELN